VKNLSDTAAQDANVRGTEQASDGRLEWVDPELVELDYEATESGVNVIFDGTTYS
jgi:hypothetical protein